MIQIQDLYFARPELLWALPPLAVLGLVYIQLRAKNKIFALSRLLVFCLILAAAANPYFVQTHTVQSPKPVITVLDDKTGSMAVFDPDAAERVADLIRAPVRSFSGDSTPLGDRILQHALPGSTILLATDGYSNSGRSLADSLALARSSNTTVFALALNPLKADASVEISGANTAVLGGDYPFRVMVRSSISYISPLSVYADEKLIYSDQILANGSASIKISNSFLETGNHILRAEIAQDMQPINDVYQKSIYVVPKPEVLLLSSGDSPLAQNLDDLYKLTVVSELPKELQDYKSIVIDDIEYTTSLDRLKDYVREGGGLIVVGGKDSYDLGEYRNTSLEELLPVRSIPSRFQGGKTLIFVLDISFSLMSTLTKDGTTLLDYEKALTVELLQSPQFQDYNVGLVVFGTRAYNVIDPIPLSRSQTVLADRITTLAPTGTEDSHLDSGLGLARDMILASGGYGEIIVLSDGNLHNYQEVVARSKEMIREMNITTRLIQVQAFPGMMGNFQELASSTDSEFNAFVYPDSLTTTSMPQPEKEQTPEEDLSTFALAVVNKNHYITTDLELNATITGFNDVTPKSGSLKLVALADGKPVLTVWRYGLGRVAALTTDDGTAWAGLLYSSPSSQLISSAVNWAVGDPRPETDRVEGEDGWKGTPLEITISSSSRPSLPEAVVEKIGDDRYLATFTPNSTGIYYMGDYGLAVNYPLEYRYIGFNPELPGLIMANGGKVFTEEEAGRSLIAEAARTSQRTVQERTSRRDALLLFALLIFLLEIVSRKIDEIRRQGRSKR